MIKRLKKYIIVALLCVGFSSIMAQSSGDYYSVDYTTKAQKVTLAGVNITGSESYEEYMLLGFSGLSVGQELSLPGPELTSCVKKFWKQGFFSDVQINLDTLRNDSLWITIALKQLPKITDVNYYGLRTSEIEDVELKLDLKEGKQINKDLIDRSKIAIKSYLSEKGYGNAEILVYQKPDVNIPGNVFVDISVDKREKVKVRNFIVMGNSALTVKQIDKAMKKTNQKKNIMNLFRTKKFVAKEFENDKALLIDEYNENGYRDAVLLRDSVINVNDGEVDIMLHISEGKKYYMGDIKWLGNTVYPEQFLSEVLNIQKGEVYNSVQLDKRLFQDEDAVSALYKDNGYLFMQLEPVEVSFEGDTIDIEMRMMEGPQATIKNVIINGNDRLYEHVVRREMRTKPGALYSQSDLIRTLRELAQLKQFDEEKIYNGVDIQPDYEDGTVDIVYNLESKSSDQVEFSAGWGQSGVVLSLGLKFSNFAIQNLFKPEMYRIVPQGEGQTLSLRAQTNGIYYQNYSISFFDPWLGGKRPNSFSFSVYYAIQTGLSQRYYDSYQNVNDYYYNQYGYNNNYMYGQGSMGSEYDKNVYMRTLGASVGFGTRMTWPDDYFTFFGEVSYQNYNLKNWYKYYYGFESGRSNDLSLSLTLARNSIDNPIYTRRGSSISLSVNATFPYSLVDGIDYANATEQEKFKWVEYHKWKFNAKLFTPLTRDDKLVLMSRVEYGFLGYYNKDKKSPFGKFYMGGDGMSGYTTAGSETIGLRGYTSGSITPLSKDQADLGYNGNIYTKLALELRYPLLLKQSTTIWALAFVEAGNCWSDFKDFNPFDLKRSAGVGVRVFLPMFGLLGIDWGYGFDHNNQDGGLGGSQFHFVLGQEF